MVELNFDMADAILEWTFDVSRYANIFILRGEIIICRGESVRNKGKTKNKLGLSCAKLSTA